MPGPFPSGEIFWGDPLVFGLVLWGGWGYICMCVCVCMYVYIYIYIYIYMTDIYIYIYDRATEEISHSFLNNLQVESEMQQV